jgi:hypothetical protein
VVNDIAAALGVTGLPGPVTDANDDSWFVWEPIVCSGGFNAVGRSGWSFPFDSKAMRKVDQGYQVVMLAENASSSIAFELSFGFSILGSRA